jgi:galactofuranosylgalactofuranosylrhamnosyl-N-acetylglucosaminyl-diphospho-decaprenol beta-1,5/1,6-galactofuranosyltransferase
MVRESFNHQVKHLVSMQYSTVLLRHRALQDLLAGPELLHDELGTKLAEIRALAREHSDAQLRADPDAFPAVRRRKPPRRGRDEGAIPGRRALLMSAGLAPLRQLRPVRMLSREHPEAEIPAMDAKWYRLSRYDSAVVSMPDGTSAALYRRDPEQFKDLLAKTVEIHQRLAREWPQLAATYRGALAEVTSPATWAHTFGSDGSGDDGGGDRG